ncbi:hypothetical protein [Acidiferrobacter sp.]|jgi:hypothetical protein
MSEDEPDAVYYFRKAAEGLEDEMTEPAYYLARGLLRLAEGLTTCYAPGNSRAGGAIVSCPREGESNGVSQEGGSI